MIHFKELAVRCRRHKPDTMVVLVLFGGHQSAGDIEECLNRSMSELTFLVSVIDLLNRDAWDLDDHVAIANLNQYILEGLVDVLIAMPPERWSTSKTNARNLKCQRTCSM